MQRSAFTLVELVVVILILGILAAVAAPKLLSTSASATDNGLKQTLSIIRDAIEHFAADNGGALPGANANENSFLTTLGPYVRGNEFPSNPVGVIAEDSNKVKVRNTGEPLSGFIDNTKGWIYDNTTGEFRANNSALSNDGVTPYSAY